MLACSALWNSSSLTLSKSSWASFSWQNTLMTFWPFIISSTTPSVAAMDCCMRMKYLERPPTFLVTNTIKNTPTSTTRVIHTLK